MKNRALAGSGSAHDHQEDLGGHGQPGASGHSGRGDRVAQFRRPF